jgi:hypothetical protein
MASGYSAALTDGEGEYQLPTISNEAFIHFEYVTSVCFVLSLKMRSVS